MAKLNKKSQSSTNLPWDLTFVEFCREAVLCLIELFLWLLLQPHEEHDPQGV